MATEVRYQQETPTSAEAKLGSKRLYKLVIFSEKVIPIVISGIYLLNIILSYCGIDWEGFSYIVQFLFIGFVYLNSLALRFCIYHRLFIDYLALTLVLNIIDYHWGLPLSDRDLFLMYMLISGLFLFLILYFHQRCRTKQEKREGS